MVGEMNETQEETKVEALELQPESKPEEVLGFDDKPAEPPAPLEPPEKEQKCGLQQLADELDAEWHKLVYTGEKSGAKVLAWIEDKIKELGI